MRRQYRDIQDYLQRLHGVEVSLTPNVTNKIMFLIKEWQNLPLQSTYGVVFLNAIHFKVKQEGTIVNKVACRVIGVDLDGNKDGWGSGSLRTSRRTSMLNDLRSRGVRDILLVYVYNLMGFSKAISACYPKTDILKCIVHQIHNSVCYVSYKDLKRVNADMKLIYKSATEEGALLELNRLKKSGGEKYPLIVKSGRQNCDELSKITCYFQKVKKKVLDSTYIPRSDAQMLTDHSQIFK